VNGLGQRVKKNNGSDIFFAYDEAGHLIGEYDASGAAIEETVWLGDMPVAVLKPNATSFDVFYIWTDNLGTPRLITDTANQSRWEWANTDPFGNNLPNEDPAGLGTFEYNLRFPGQYYDAEKGSNYNYFRDYDPSIGRYVESDPTGLRAGLNTYAYVAQNPLARKDVYGLGFFDWIDHWWNGQKGHGGMGIGAEAYGKILGAQCAKDCKPFRAPRDKLLIAIDICDRLQPNVQKDPYTGGDVLLTCAHECVDLVEKNCKECSQ
jgi:RHS repeat-associated protein